MTATVLPGPDGQACWRFTITDGQHKHRQFLTATGRPRLAAATLLSLNCNFADGVVVTWQISSDAYGFDVLVNKAARIDITGYSEVRCFNEISFFCPVVACFSCAYLENRLQYYRAAQWKDRSLFLGNKAQLVEFGDAVFQCVLATHFAT